MQNTQKNMQNTPGVCRVCKIIRKEICRIRKEYEHPFCVRRTHKEICRIRQKKYAEYAKKYAEYAKKYAEYAKKYAKYAEYAKKFAEYARNTQRNMQKIRRI